MLRTCVSPAAGQSCVRPLLLHVTKAKRRYSSALTILHVILLTCTFLHQAVCQSTPVQGQQALIGPSKIRPVSLEHLYWHFLVLQDFIDTKAAEQEAQGRDGNGLRHDLQKALGWPAADYAPIRTSSVRLAAKIKDLDKQAKEIAAGGKTLSSQDQLKALTVQRESAISAEITYLKQNLSAEQVSIFEIFLTRFFSPANASPRPTIGTRKPEPSAAQ